MTEIDWLTATDPWVMLRFLSESGNASDRKFRLAGCAYCRSVWEVMGKASRKAVLLGQQMADEPVNETHREAIVRAAIEAVCRFEEANGDFFMAADMAYRVASKDGWYAAEWTIGNTPQATGAVPIVRDIFGNPFSLVTVIRSMRTDSVSEIARTIYDSGDFSRLPLLADALEDAGCTDAELLGHLRGLGVHVRGCWAVDLLTGKE